MRLEDLFEDGIKQQQTINEGIKSLVININKEFQSVLDAFQRGSLTGKDKRRYEAFKERYVTPRGVFVIMAIKALVRTVDKMVQIKRGEELRHRLGTGILERILNAPNNVILKQFQDIYNNLKGKSRLSDAEQNLLRDFETIRDSVREDAQDTTLPKGIKLAQETSKSLEEYEEILANIDSKVDRVLSEDEDFSVNIFEVALTIYEDYLKDDKLFPKNTKLLKDEEEPEEDDK